MVRLWGAIFVAISALVVGGCGGGGTTTVIERVEGPAKARSQAANPALLKLPAYEHWLVEPEAYSFAVDGSFIGNHLT